MDETIIHLVRTSHEVAGQHLQNDKAATRKRAIVEEGYSCLNDTQKNRSLAH